MFDGIVIGGGFYGCAIAHYLRTCRGFSRVLVVEREPALLTRASYNNQARVHNGYHYPRSYTTAFRSRINFPRFVQDFPDAVKSDFTKLYAIARNNSKVTARQFERFCREIQVGLELAPPILTRLFEPRLIEAVFVAEEYAFDAVKLATWAGRRLTESGIELRVDTRVVSVYKTTDGLEVLCVGADGEVGPVVGQYVFNCTYCGLNQLGGDFPGTSIKLKQEITEIALIAPPPELSQLGVTVMDGPFFSIMPFPARGLHSLSHVRYTPHWSWSDVPGMDPYAELRAYPRPTRVDRMIRDAARYMPAINNASYTQSLFEVKTVLVKNEGDDGRPILFEQHRDLPHCYSILGGKIDNIYDILEQLDAEPLALGRSH